MTVLLGADALLPARNQMALSLGWHIVLACFGMAFPAMIFVLHRRGLKGDQIALELAKRWSKASGVLFAVGAVSGTVLSFEMGLLWPGLMDRFGDVIGLAFALEGIAFFIEAIFLGIYIYGWGRLPGRWHVATLLPVMVSGLFGAFMVVAVNGWMNAPTGFSISDGEVVDVDPIGAIFNSAATLQFVHMYLAAMMVVGFTVAGIYSLGWLKGRTDRLHRLGIVVPLCFAAVAAPLQPVVGHFAGQRLADEQPIKLAAMEGLAETTEAARLEIGGWWNGEHLVGAVEIPVDGLLSFIATNDFGATVIGLDAVPASDLPPVGIVHVAFQTMVAIGTALIGLVGWAAWRWWRDRDRGIMTSRRLLWALVVSGPAAVVAMEAGWVTTEVGRQPWIVHNTLRTADAVTASGFIWVTLGVLVVVYSAMTFGVWFVLRSMSRRWRAGEKDLPSPYGPASIGEDRVLVGAGSGVGQGKSAAGLGASASVTAARGEAGLDRGAQPDSESQLDRGAQPDSGSELDRGAQPDSGSELDRGAQPDSGSELDRGAQPDGGSGLDRGAQPDGGSELDRGAQPDSGSELDRGAQPDSESQLDRGAQPDAGGVL